MNKMIVVALVAACSAHVRHDAHVGNVAPKAARASAIAGNYRATHTTRVVCATGSDGWCEESVDDTMTIRDTRDGAIAVTIQLVQTNEHTCSFEDKLTQVGPQRWQFSKPDEEGPCTLVLEATRRTIAISSDGCRFYCGVRASLDAVFPRTS